ncbi:winged helix-turn-helix domain-containing protein [Ornithinimicrobium faecis]|uniref:winged helix-turn-helix domain-containing protein n=1 Tax=Ornithinimicrobium faecis TaxID=2934158 RepID=UPI00211991C9|nr:winged helix-turn-helix domain-containing protein [Ornithinimicrobium sp. HY1745]
MEQTVHAPASGPVPEPEPLVLIVADTAEQRLALSAGLPIETPILLASDITEARRVLARLPGASGRGRRQPAPPGASGPPRGGRPQELPLRLREDRLSLAVADREVQLTRLEFALLRYLVPRAGQVVTFEQLSQVGWHTAYLGNGAHMHAAIGRLRTKLAELRAPVLLEAVRGLGFRLVQHPRSGAPKEALGS